LNLRNSVAEREKVDRWHSTALEPETQHWFQLLNRSVLDKLYNV